MEWLYLEVTVQQRIKQNCRCGRRLLSAVCHDRTCMRVNVKRQAATSRRFLWLPGCNDVLPKAYKVRLLLEERMIEQLISTCTFIHVDFETSVQEIRKILRQLWRILEFRLAVGCDEEQCSDGRLVQVWRFTFDHFNHHDSQTPHVHFVAVTLPTHSTFHAQAWNRLKPLTVGQHSSPFPFPFSPPCSLSSPPCPFCPSLIPTPCSTPSCLFPFLIPIYLYLLNPDRKLGKHSELPQWARPSNVFWCIFRMKSVHLFITCIITHS